MKTAKAVKFAKDWSKLKDDFFLTVRWRDTVYRHHSVLPIIIEKKNSGYGKVMFTIDIKLRDLLYEGFTRYDADCDVEEYYNLIKKFYYRKPDWNGEDSLVQIVGIRKVKAPNQRSIMG